MDFSLLDNNVLHTTIYVEVQFELQKKDANTSMFRQEGKKDHTPCAVPNAII